MGREAGTNLSNDPDGLMPGEASRKERRSEVSMREVGRMKFIRTASFWKLREFVR